MAKWNAHIIIFGWCEHILMGISWYFRFSILDGAVQYNERVQ